MIVSFNFYYARPGFADAVLAQRLRACEVRVDLGLPRGRVLVRQDEIEVLPEVVWELAYADVGGHVKDMAARAASPEFEAVRAGMRRLYRRFERPLYQIRGGAPSAGDASRASPIVSLDWVYCTAQDAARIVASVRESSGNAAEPADSALLQLITPGDDLPQLVWRREHGESHTGARNHFRLPDAEIVAGKLCASQFRVVHSRWSVR
jgi:hypothetical protein